MQIEIPSLEVGYSVFFDPGGPGTTPLDNENFTREGPAHVEPVIIAWMIHGGSVMIPMNIKTYGQKIENEISINALDREERCF